MNLTADIQLNEFNRGLARYTNKLGLDSKRVFKKEVGELIKTLVKLSPPKNLASSKKSADKDVRRVFRPMPLKMFPDSKAGNRDMRWLYASPYALVGVLKEHYKPSLNGADGYQYYQSAKASFGNSYGRVTTGGKTERRGQQALMRLARVVTSRSTIAAIHTKVRGNFGRLKAGWMAGVFNGQIALTGAGKPPAWVVKHRSGVRGASINGLNIPGKPSFTIINKARGVSSANVQRVARAALGVRAKAMASNLKRIMSGQKEYAY